MAITYTQKLALEKELSQTYKHSAWSICSQYMRLSSFTLMGSGTMLCPRLKRIFQKYKVCTEIYAFSVQLMIVPSFYIILFPP